MHVATLYVCVTAMTFSDVYDSCHSGSQVASGMSHHFGVCILPMYLVNVIANRGCSLE